jgi:putative ABC transport system permease protein
MVIGTTSDFLQARKLTMERGQFLPPSDMDVGAPVLVLGHQAARELFGQSNPIGEPIRVGSARMRVIGVLAERGEQLGQNVDDMVYMPAATAMRLFNRSSLFRIIVEIYAFEDLETVKEQVLAILTERHGEEDVTLLTQDAVLTSLGGILRALTLGLGAIAAISLAVAGIGIMNVMLVSVAERRSEIGLLKALGAKRFEILLLFLCEATLLSIAGGVIGLIAGWTLVKITVLIYPALPATTPAWAVVSVMGLAAAIGPLFGSVSAWKAAKLDPVLALMRL